MNNLTVKSINGNYSVFIGEGSSKWLPSFIEDKYDKAVIITDSNVFHFHEDKISSLQKTLKSHLLVLPPGERTKSFKTVNSILSRLSLESFTRDSLIIAVGGGVVGDVSGFAASVYMRGINIIHIPTTLLSSVDSSVGGKTGINYQNKKNLVGSFYNPQLVLVDPSFLFTLPDDEFYSGMGEVVKYAFLAGGDFYKKAFSLGTIKKEDTNSLCTIITNCLSYKASTVEKDEKDAGLRQLLNLGHTFAHAYESASNFSIKHGSAVSLGIISSLYLSNALNLISKEKLDEYLRIPKQFKPSKKLKISEKDVFPYMLTDKKNKNGDINFVLLKEPGVVLLNVMAEKKEVISSIKKTFSV